MSQTISEKLNGSTLDRFKATAQLWAFGALKIPVLFFLKPRVLQVDVDKTEVVIKLNRKTKNHLGSMYFGVLAAGADVAGGLLAYRLVQEKGKKVSLAFKEFEAKFHKRAEGDTHFICTQGKEIEEFVDEVLSQEERKNRWVEIEAYSAPDFKEPVASFRLLLSLKRK